MRSLILIIYYLLAIGLMAGDAESASESESENNHEHSEVQEAAQNKSAIKGITVADGLKLLVDNRHVKQYDELRVVAVLIWALLGSLPCPAFIPGALPLSMVWCGFEHQNMTQALDDPACVAGLS